MASYNPLNNQNNIGISSNTENKGLFSRMLRNLSNFGMTFDDMVHRNTTTIGMNEDPRATSSGDLYSYMSSRAVASVLNKKSIPYLDRSYIDKKKILREYSIKDYLRDFLSTICDEIIIYKDKDFCSPKPLSNDYPQDVTDKYQEYFERIYNKYGFSDGITAWNMTKDFLIDGYIANEIVWDDKKKNIIYFNRLAPETLVPAYEPSIGNLWIQYPEDPQLRRILLDSQIVFVSYSTQNYYTETSYIEGLIKPYNQLKIIEQTRIMFNIVNATVYQKFTIPTKGLPRGRAEEQMGQLIADYSEDVEWDDTLGTLKINGTKHLPYNKQLWFPDGDAGTPQMELVSPEGHNLNESDMLKWFHNAMNTASKIPFGRFQEENGGGNISTDASEMTRDEVKFGNYIGRVRAILKELVVKPLKLQMCMEFPELKDDEVFLNQVDIIFNSNQLFETWKKLANMEKRSTILTNLLGIQKADGQPYFHIDYLIDKVMELSSEEKEENKSYWAKSNGAGSGTEPSGDSGGESEGGGGESQGSPPETSSEETPPTETPPPAEGGSEFDF
jgi:hypothetical protein